MVMSILMKGQGPHKSGTNIINWELILLAIMEMYKIRWKTAGKAKSSFLGNLKFRYFG